MNIKKTLISLACLLTAGMLFAQKPVTVVCQTGEGIGKSLHLWRVEKGEQKSMAIATYAGNGYYGFNFIPEYEGFYVIGDEGFNQYPLYLKAGDEVSLYMDKDTVCLTGKHNSRENQALCNWANLSRTVRDKALHFQKVRSTYEDFFPDFEKLLAESRDFKASLKTKNARFNELMARYVGCDLDNCALAFIYTPRSKHPSKEQRIAYYNTIINPEKFADTLVLDMPCGMELLNRYIMHNSLENKLNSNDLEKTLAIIPNRQVQSEIVLKRAQGFGRSYYDFLGFMQEARPFVNDAQYALMEQKASQLYEARKGGQAKDFTYPDANGKMHALSDYKGKVVVVDVWATWCGPCKQELPHLKALEKEMHGNPDIVFIGVSVDKKKDYEKWKKFIADEQLPGIQLFSEEGKQICKDYKINGIPRFMVFAKDGSVVDSNAPRPSSPGLKLMLEAELKK